MNKIVLLIGLYSYFAILPASIIEGPIVAVIAAFLASQHILNVFIVYPLVVLGDVIGDVLHYWAGRAGRQTFIPKYGKYIGATEERINAVSSRFDEKNAWKTIFFGKFTHAPNSAILVLAGVSRVNFWAFLLISTLSTIPKTLVFMLIGWYFGASYEKISYYIKDFGYIVVGVLLAILVVYLWQKRAYK